MKRFLMLAFAATITSLAACKKDDTNHTKTDQSAATHTFAVDSSFPKREEIYEQTTLQPDKKLVAASLNNGVFRLNADGSKDNSFQADASLSGSQHFYSVIALQADGKILLAYSPGATSDDRIVRLNANGTLDNSFASPALVATSDPVAIDAIEVLSNGDLCIGGRFYYVQSGNYYRDVARLTSSGAIDFAFKSPLASTPYVTALELMPDGNLLASGRISATAGSNPTYGFVKLNSATGAVMADFASPNRFWTTPRGLTGQGFQYADGAREIIFQPDGKIIVRGDFGAIGPDFQGATDVPGMARLNGDGSLDASFRPEDGGPVALLANGDLLIGKYYPPLGTYSTQVRFSVMDVSGKLRYPFAGVGFDEGSGRITRIIRLSESEALLTGEFHEGGTTYGLIKIKK